MSESVSAKSENASGVRGNIVYQSDASAAINTALPVSLPDRPGFATGLRILILAYGIPMTATTTPQPARAQAPANVLSNSPAAVTTQVTALSSMELWLAGVIILFGFVVLLMQFALLRRTENPRPDDVLRLFTVTMIIIGTLALIAVGYSSQQIAPALGLFGTIVGYLLGRTDERARLRRVSEETTESDQHPKTP